MQFEAVCKPATAAMAAADLILQPYAKISLLRTKCGHHWHHHHLYHHHHPPTHQPQVLGGDLASYVEEADEGSRFKKGDAVAALTRGYFVFTQDGESTGNWRIMCAERHPEGLHTYASKQAKQQASDRQEQNTEKDKLPFTLKVLSSRSSPTQHAQCSCGARCHFSMHYNVSMLPVSARADCLCSSCRHLLPLCCC
jgi:hypothetical protein